MDCDLARKLSPRPRPTYDFGIHGQSRFNDDGSERTLATPTPGTPTLQPASASTGLSPNYETSILTIARGYLRRGFAVLPQLPGAKHPCVKWKPFQKRLPTDGELEEWFQRWPQAGLAVVLGPVSNLVAIDVDGPEADEVLIARLGEEPKAPKVLSGSGKPHRHHFFFRHPSVLTNSKFTPWHEKLEFRGNRGIIVLPPSIHSSGNQYRFAPGQSFAEMPLPELPPAIVEEWIVKSLRRRGRSAQAKPSATAPCTVKLDADPSLQKVRKYIAQLPAAIEGQGGDKLTYTVACRLVIDFGLDPEQAMPLLKEYSERCDPPWSDAELWHKLEKAAEKADENPDERGRLLHGRLEKNPSDSVGLTAVLPKPILSAAVHNRPYLGTIPNHVMGDWEKVKPRSPWRGEGGLRRGRPRSHSGLMWLLHREIIRQKRSTVYLPDILLAQTVWGGDWDSWPRNWRLRLRGWLADVVRWFCQGDSTLATSSACDHGCPLQGQLGIRHSHFVVTVAQVVRMLNHNEAVVDFDRSFLGILELFGWQEGGERVFSFSRGESPENVERQQQIDHLKKAGRLYSVYLPLLVFGPSPRSGLSSEQQKILLALTREVTRTTDSHRDDKAALLTGGKPCTSGGDHIALPPNLQYGKRYVCFNGNGAYKRRHLRGRGYKLIGRTGGGWLSRVGLQSPDDARNAWQTIRGFLENLSALAGPFGLVVAAWHPPTQQYRQLEEIIGMTQTLAGQRWLRECNLRVYTEEDYLTRWRKYFADKMGFSLIAGGHDEEAQPPNARTTAVMSATDLDCWMRKVGMTDQELARRLGLSRSYVSRMRAGRKPWSNTFQTRIAPVVSMEKAETILVPEVTKNVANGTNSQR